MVPFHLTAAMAVADTRLVATLPARLGGLVRADPTMTLVPAPVEVEQMSYFMVYHPRLSDDPAQGWLRDVVRQCAAEIGTPDD